MSDLLSARGCVYRWGVEGRSDAGWYDVKGLRQEGSLTPVLIQGIQLAAVDLVQPVITLDNSKILYTFGEDFTAVTAFGDILLGSAAGNAGAGMNQVQNFFLENRVSKLKNTVSFSAPGSLAYSVYLTGLQFGHVDPEFHIQPWALQGVVAALVGT